MFDTNPKKSNNTTTNNNNIKYGMRSTTFLPLSPAVLWTVVEVPVSAPGMSQIDVFDNY